MSDSQSTYAKALIRKAIERREAKKEAKRRKHKGKISEPEHYVKPTDKIRCRNPLCQFKEHFGYPADWPGIFTAFCPFCGQLGRIIVEGEPIRVNWEDPKTQEQIWAYTNNGFVRSPDAPIDPYKYVDRFREWSRKRSEELQPDYIWYAYTDSEKAIEKTVASIDMVKMAEAGFPEPMNCNPLICSFKGRSCFVGYSEGGAKEGRCRLGMMLCGVTPTSQRMRMRSGEVQRVRREKVKARLRLKQKLKGIGGGII